MHESLDEFEFQPDSTTNSRVICPCASEKLMFNVVNTLVSSFLIRSSSFLQVRSTTNKSGQGLNFGQIRPRAGKLRPLIDVRNSFLLKILRMDGMDLFKFCIHIIIAKIYVGIVKHLFSQICNGITALDCCWKLVLLNILRMVGQNLTKFCIHIIIDKIYVVIGKHHFSQICNGVTALYCWKLDLLNILRMDGQNLTKFCIHIINDKIYVGIIKRLANLQQSYGPQMSQKLVFAQYVENQLDSNKGKMSKSIYRTS